MNSLPSASSRGTGSISVGSGNNDDATKNAEWRTALCRGERGRILLADSIIYREKRKQDKSDKHWRARMNPRGNYLPVEPSDERLRRWLLGEYGTKKLENQIMWEAEAICTLGDGCDRMMFKGKGTTWSEFKEDMWSGCGDISTWEPPLSNTIATKKNQKTSSTRRQCKHALIGKVTSQCLHGVSWWTDDIPAEHTWNSMSFYVKHTVQS